MPMVGMLSASVTAAAMGAGMHSSTIAKQPLSCRALAWLITRTASLATWACGLNPPVSQQGRTTAAAAAMHLVVKPQTDCASNCCYTTRPHRALYEPEQN